APAGFTIAGATGQVSWTPSAAGSFAVTLRATNASGFAEQSFTLVAGTQPTVPATILQANASALVYLPSERLALGAAKSQQRLNVFLPPGTAPLGGWPVVLNNRAGGGLAALPLGALQNTGVTAPLHAFVASGIAVVDFGVTGIGNGQGLFYPPGHASGRYESFRPGDDNPEKDAEWALQWLKTQASFPLSRTNICLRGSSQGAILGLWCALGPERARVTGSAQVRASTKVKGVLALQPPTSNWAFDQDPTFASNMIAHYEQAAAPGVAATTFRQVAENLQKANSVMGFAFASLEARSWNESQAVCLIYNEPVLRVGGAVADMGLDAAGYPRLRDALGVPFVHDSWAGYVFFRRLLDLSPSSATFHRANSLFAVRDTTALPAPQNWHTSTYAGLLTGAPATALAHGWVLRTLGVAAR
ncbi:MAG: Ig domain-containing protein, partial [Planctomycetota bacterium]